MTLITDSMLALVVLTTGYTILLCAPIGYTILKRQFDIFEIINPVIIVLIITFAIRPIILMNYPEVTDHPEIINLSTMNVTLIYVIIGTSCMFLGYYMLTGVSFSGKFIQIINFGDEAYTRLVVLFILGTSLIAYGYLNEYFGRIAYKTVEDFPMQNYVLNIGKYTWYASIALVMIDYKDLTIKKRVITVVLCVITMAIAIASGERVAFISLVAMMVMGMYYKGKIRLNLRYMVMLAIVVTSVFYSMETYRNRVIYTDFVEIGDEIQTSNRSLLGDVAWKIIHRQHMFDSFSVIHENIPAKQPFFGGGDFLLVLPKTLIPRFIWKNKPEYEFQKVFRDTLWKIGPWPAPSVFGSLYARGGLIALILGMFVIGIVLKLFYLNLIKGSNQSTASILIYCIFFMDLLRISTEADIIAIDSMIKVLIYLVPFFYVVRRKHGCKID